MLYRPGFAINAEAWNMAIETRIVNDDDIEAALADGWFMAADIMAALEPEKPKAKAKATPA